MTPFRRRIGDSAHASTTFIAPTTRIVGTISGQGAFVFCGSVEGECDIEGTTTLAAGGRWVGTMKATDVVVAGDVDGDVFADRKVEIAGTARVSGSLSGHSVAVAEGAIIEGEIRIANGGAASTFEEKRRV